MEVGHPANPVVPHPEGGGGVPPALGDGTRPLLLGIQIKNLPPGAVPDTDPVGLELHPVHPLDRLQRRQIPRLGGGGLAGTESQSSPVRRPGQMFQPEIGSVSVKATCQQIADCQFSVRRKIGQPPAVRRKSRLPAREPSADSAFPFLQTDHLKVPVSLRNVLLPNQQPPIIREGDAGYPGNFQSILGGKRLKGVFLFHRGSHSFLRSGFSLRQRKNFFSRPPVSSFLSLYAWTGPLMPLPKSQRVFCHFIQNLVYTFTLFVLLSKI